MQANLQKIAFLPPKKTNLFYNRKSWLVVMFLLIITFSFFGKISAQTHKIITFEAFIQKFTPATLPFEINKKTLATPTKGKILLSWEEIEKYLLQPLNDTSALYYYSQNDKKQEEIFVKKKRINYFAISQLSLYEGAKSLVIYRQDNSIKMGFGLLAYSFLLISFDKNHNLIQRIPITIAQEEYFMTSRFTECMLSKYKNESILLKQTEYDYVGVDRSRKTKPTYILERYYKITNNFMIEDCNVDFYPYIGDFVAPDGSVLSIDQNKDFFMVLKGQVGDNSSIGQEVLQYDLKQGTFSIKIFNTTEIWTGIFDKDITQITITKPDKRVVIYKRKR